MSNPYSERRRANFIALVASRFSTQEEAAEALGISSTYVSFISTGHKVLGEKLARRMEIKAGLAPGYFDRAEHGGSSSWHEQIDQRMEADPGFRLLVQLVLDDPDAPIPEGIRPTLKTMLDGLKKALLDAARPGGPSTAQVAGPPVSLSAKRS